MHKGTAFVLIAAALVGGYAIGRSTGGHEALDAHDSAPTAAAEHKVAFPSAPSDGVERKRVPIGTNFRGTANALVTIVEYSDFQCPYCGRAAPTIEQILKQYAGKVRFYFKHDPLPFHQNAPLASQAALAAGAQGKFWEMHDKLFAHQQNLLRPDLEKYAQEIGVDLTRFKADLDSGKFKAQVDRDTAEAGQVGVDGTPAFFINGRPLSGAQPFEQFKTIIDDEILRANKLVAQGTPAAQIYDKFMAMGSVAGAAPAPAPAAPSRPAVPTDVMKAEVGNAPVRGGKQPKVTIVEYSEFQCPYCGKVAPTVKQIIDTYGPDVAVAFKHFPLPFHENAALASQAAMAAGEQGKFWQMHDKLFENQQALTRADLEKYGEQLGLNMGKFKAALDKGTFKQAVESDAKSGQALGVQGTPSFFINGRFFVGAQPFDNFKPIIDEEIGKADARLKAGVARKDLYAELMKGAKDKPAPAAPARAAAGEPDAGTVYKADIAGAPVKGAKDALVTIVQFSDFQCPFCSRVEPTIDQVMEAYKGKVRVVWRDLPLPFHPNALPCAIAARAAGEQGKFWEMHDKLFKNQQNQDRASLEKYAEELKLNMPRFKAALDQQKFKKEIDADSAAGAKIGARGTPAFFVNGTFLSGAQPFEAFKQRIDQELKKAEALVAKGTPKSKVYDTIMKGAKTEVVAAAPAAPGAPAAAPEEAGPEKDNQIYPVKPGKSYAKGPQNAPVTVVLFSDFQCPFCKRVEPTITELQKTYGGKIRVVWKNFPLEFHPNAKPAALAVMAAGEQGKFWEMHDKLFENQQSLDRPSLEKYAQELSLDMGKFKSAMDSSKYMAEIDAEAKEGAAVGVNGTPAAFINGRKISGAYPIDTFKKIVDQELAKGRKGS